MMIKRVLFSLPLFFFCLSPLQASNDVDELVSELQQLADKSRQERAADRWLQNALEDLVAKYSFPWKNSLLIDDFSDGDYQQNVRWEILSGEFWVDRRLGLRSSVVAEEKPASAPQSQSSSNQQQDFGRALFGALMQEALKPQGAQTSQSQAVEKEMIVTPAKLITTLDIPTTFAISSKFAQNDRPGTDGRFEWLVMQDKQASNAFKLVISTGNKAFIDLVSIRNGRDSYLESKELAALSKGGEHTFSWRQNSDGQIEVFLDGEEVIKTSGPAFRHGFKYLGLTNHQGDFSVSAVEVLGGA